MFLEGTFLPCPTGSEDRLRDSDPSPKGEDVNRERRTHANFLCRPTEVGVQGDCKCKRNTEDRLGGEGRDHYRNGTSDVWWYIYKFG